VRGIKGGSRYSQELTIKRVRQVLVNPNAVAQYVRGYFYFFPPSIVLIARLFGETFAIELNVCTSDWISVSFNSRRWKRGKNHLSCIDNGESAAAAASPVTPIINGVTISP
jgi:hypothetical protein